MHDRMIVSATARSGAVVAFLDALSMRAALVAGRLKPMVKTYGPTFAVMAVIGIFLLVTPQTAAAQSGSNVWQSLDNVNKNAQGLLIKVMITVGILMIMIGAWMWKGEKGGAIPVMLLGLAMIVIGAGSGTIMSRVGGDNVTMQSGF